MEHPGRLSTKMKGGFNMAVYNLALFNLAVYNLAVYNLSVFNLDVHNLAVYNLAYLENYRIQIYLYRAFQNKLCTAIASPV